jgi:hypothetical protein
MSSAASPIKAVLEGYVAGRVKAERVVEAVAAAYYEKQGVGRGAWLRELLDVIERAHPGIVELTSAAAPPGFGVRLATRPFPKEYEGALRQAAQAALTQESTPTPHAPRPTPGLWSRLYTAVRRFFTAST